MLRCHVCQREALHFTEDNPPPTWWKHRKHGYLVCNRCRKTISRGQRAPAYGMITYLTMEEIRDGSSDN